MSVPYVPRPRARPTDLMKRLAAGRDYYQLYFQELGRPDSEFEEDVRSHLAGMYWTFSGEGLRKAAPWGRFCSRKASGSSTA